MGPLREWRARVGGRLPGLAFCVLVVFALVTWQVVAGGPLRRADERLGRSAQGVLPDGFAQFLADLGGMPVALPVLALAMGCAALRGRRRGLRRWWRAPFAAALAMAAVPTVVVPLKALVARPGPPGGGPCDCYPSGHAATALVAYGAAAVLLAPRLRGIRVRWTAAAGALGPANAAALGLVFVLNVGVGAGLVVRGYHWPLDVLGSWLLGALACLVGLAGLRCRRPGVAGVPGAAPDAGRPHGEPGPVDGDRGRR